MTDIRTLLHRTTRELTAGGSPSPRLDAEVLLMNFLKTDRVQLYMHPERELPEEECAGFTLWVERRRRGEPVAYITGEKEFWSLFFEVNRDVLIPRPETECLIEEVLKYYGREAGPLRIIDLGTGSGAIGVVLAAEIPVGPCDGDGHLTGGSGGGAPECRPPRCGRADGISGGAPLCVRCRRI